MQTLVVKTVTKIASEEVRYVFDFQQYSEVIAGETLSAPAVSVVAVSPDSVATNTLTIGTPAVTSAAITENNKTVPAGKGVQCLIEDGTSGAVYTVDCVVTLSGGGKRTRRGQIKIM